MYLVSIVNKYILNIMSSIYVDYHIQIILLVWLLFVQLPQMNLRYQFSQIFVGLVIDKSEILQDLARFFSMNPWLSKFWKRDRDAKLVFSGKKIDHKITQTPIF